MVTKVSVFCIFRDSEKSLVKLFAQLEELEAIGKYEFSYFFYENDSTDKTADILKNWIEKREGLVYSEKINSEKFGSVATRARIDNMTAARNKCKRLADKNKSDYSLLIDSDICFNEETFLELVHTIKIEPKAVYASCNIRQNIPDFTFNISKDSYYDSSCLRDKYGNEALYWSNCPFKRKRDRLDWSLGFSVQIRSGFGGFSLVKSDVFNQVEWSNDLNIEHVNFCYDIGEFGNLYINPRAIATTEIDLTKYDLNQFARVASQQFYEK